MESRPLPLAQRYEADWAPPLLFPTAGMPKLSKEAKQRLQQLFRGGQFAIRWGFIPVVLYLGQCRAGDRPHGPPTARARGTTVGEPATGGARAALHPARAVTGSAWAPCGAGGQKELHVPSTATRSRRPAPRMRHRPRPGSAEGPAGTKRPLGPGVAACGPHGARVAACTWQHC